MKIEVDSKLLVQLGKFFTPIVLGISVLWVVGFLLDESLRVRFWSLCAGYFFPPLGKESIIPTGIALGINPLLMGLSIAFIDIVVALFLVWNYDLAKKIPLVGRFMVKVENIGRSSSEKYSWVKPLRFIGIVLFVMVPFQGSGSLVGSILGRLIGMKPWNTFLAISIGTVSGCLLIACFADVMKSVFVKNFLLGLLILVILIVIVIIVFIYRKTKKN